MADCLVSVDPEYCPDLDDCHEEFRALLPDGKAWEAKGRDGAVLWRYWRALAHPFAYAHERICALRRQFWCADTDELRDGWLVEYGLPDACDPFPDLCAKVAALGGTRCEYYQEIARRAGWLVRCSDETGLCGNRVDRMRMDCARTGGPVVRNRLTFTVSLAESPAYTAPTRGPIRMDCTRVDAAFGCGPDIGALACILERITPAHVEVVYRFGPSLAGSDGRLLYPLRA